MIKKITQSEVIWNMIGSLTNALSSVLLLLIVTRTNGSFDAGIFSIGFATAQLMETIGLYEVRSFQVTDVKNHYTFSDYLTFRIFSCFLMIVVSIIYAFVKNEELYKMIVLLLLCLYKMIDALSDVFQGLFQKNHRLDLSGKVLAYRVILSTILFAFILFLNHDLIFACVAMVVVSMISLLLFDFKYYTYFKIEPISFNFNKLKKLALECFPLFIGSFILIYIINAPKYAIDSCLSEDIQAYFSILFMPASVINLMTLFVFRPVQTKLAIAWNDNRLNEFRRTVLFQMILITIFTFTVIICGYLVGVPVLSYVYGVDLSGTELALALILFGGGCNAVMTILYYILTIIRAQKQVLYGYMFVGLITYIIAPKLVKLFELAGATLSYVLSMSLLIVVLLIILYKQVREMKKI